MARAAAKASDLYCEEPDRDDVGLAVILPDTWELPRRRVLRNPRRWALPRHHLPPRGWLVMLREGPEGVVGAAATATVHVVHPLLPHLEFRLPDEFSLFEIHAAADLEEHVVRLPLSKEARLRSGLPLAERLQRVYKPDEKNYPYITMVALSCSPAGSDDDDCVALCVYRCGRCLAIARPGDASWARVEVGWEYMEPTEYNRKFVSVVHLNGSFYAACYDGTVLRVTIPPAGSSASTLPRVEKFADRPYRSKWSMWRSRWWLAADGAGSLVFIGTERCLNPWDDERYLSVFRWDDELRFWRRPKSFGGRALFLSAGTAFFADARILPWCAGDCIYLTDDESVVTGENVTVRCYDMRSRKLYFVEDAGAKVALAPPVWVMPFHE
uniref:KIB1-4 beta-propeller domain-containing protein n=1 Tax=Oryza glumipatula TaxID=40148 RepID=A0A0E0AGK4_9ORYZ